MSAHVITDYSLVRFVFPRNRITGDSQVRSDLHQIGALTLSTQSGLTGLGFFTPGFSPFPGTVELKRVFEETVLPRLRGRDIFPMVNAVGRPRGSNNQGLPHGFGQAVDQAVWDLIGKATDLPLYRLLGGSSPEVEAYASDLGSHATDDETRALAEQARAAGFTRIKVKVGHPDVEWDLARLQLVQNACGRDMVLMVDANEAWSPKEAIMRLKTYKSHGFDIFWVEDPCARDDFEGLREIRQAVPETLVNSGEYLDLHGKRLLMEARGADVINVHGVIGASMRAAWLAHEHSLRVSVGNTPLELGVHIAAALPKWAWMEYSFHNTAHLVESPVEIRNGKAYAPDRPGHGLVLSENAVARWASTEPAVDPAPFDEAPPSPIDYSAISTLRSTARENFMAQA